MTATLRDRLAAELRIYPPGARGASAGDLAEKIRQADGGTRLRTIEVRAELLAMEQEHLVRRHRIGGRNGAWRWELVAR